MNIDTQLPFNGISLVGGKFGRLTVLGYVGKDPVKRRYYWLCKCDCGESCTVRGDQLKDGTSKSCGCLHREIVAALKFKHGSAVRHKTRGKLYRAWEHMRSRCFSKEGSWYWEDYGKKGIKVCPEWDDFTKFAEHIGEPPSSKHSVDRIDNKGNYEPGNVRWATQPVQVGNRGNVVRFEWRGETMMMVEWSRKFQIPWTTFYFRVRKLGGPEALESFVREGRIE